MVEHRDLFLVSIMIFNLFDYHNAVLSYDRIFFHSAMEGIAGRKNGVTAIRRYFHKISTQTQSIAVGRLSVFAVPIYLVVSFFDMHQTKVTYVNPFFAHIFDNLSRIAINAAIGNVFSETERRNTTAECRH